jgi:hypothetical protein
LDVPPHLVECCEAILQRFALVRYPLIDTTPALACVSATRLEGSVRIPAVLDPQHDGLVQFVVDAVEHAVGASPDGPDAGEVVRELLTHPVGLATRVVVRKSMTAAATASGSFSAMARWAGGVRTSS